MQGNRGLFLFLAFFVFNLSTLYAATQPSEPKATRICSQLLLPGNTAVIKYYKAIQAYYGHKRAKRSNLPLINHIDEGLVILDRIGASWRAKAAWCIHPMVQGDTELSANFQSLQKMDPRVVSLAIEYRSVANEYLSTRLVWDINEIRLSPLKDVNDMLVADKIQNRKDFEKYHQAKHARSGELSQYFKNWLERLGVSEDAYQQHVAAITPKLEDYKAVNGPFYTWIANIDLPATETNPAIPLRVYYPEKPGKYPVIVFSHGGGLNRTSHEFLGKFWASHGYISIHPTHTSSDSSILKNDNPKTMTVEERDFNRRVIHALGNIPEPTNQALRNVEAILGSLDTVAKLLPGFSGELDASRVGIAGFSFGAHSTLAAAGANYIGVHHPLVSKAKAFVAISAPSRAFFGASLDSWSQMDAPILSFSGTKDVGLMAEPAELRVEPFLLAPAGDKYHVLIQDANHFSFVYRRPGKEAFDDQVHAKLKILSLLFLDYYVKGKTGLRTLIESPELSAFMGGGSFVMSK